MLKRQIIVLCCFLAMSGLLVAHKHIKAAATKATCTESCPCESCGEGCDCGKGAACGDMGCTCVAK